MKSYSLFAFSALIALLFHSCTINCHENKTNLFDKIKEEVSNPETDVLQMSKITKFEWDRLLIAMPYTSPEVLDKELGFEWPCGAKTKIQDYDSFSLLIFLKDKKVVEFVKYSRSLGDFSSQPDDVKQVLFFIPQTAIFTIDRGDNWINLSAQ